MSLILGWSFQVNGCHIHIFLSSLPLLLRADRVQLRGHFLFSSLLTPCKSSNRSRRRIWNPRRSNIRKLTPLPNGQIHVIDLRCRSCRHSRKTEMCCLQYRRSNREVPGDMDIMRNISIDVGEIYASVIISEPHSLRSISARSSCLVSKELFTWTQKLATQQRAQRSKMSRVLSSSETEGYRNILNRLNVSFREDLDFDVCVWCCVLRGVEADNAGLR